jgi:hypothetical protein
VTGVVNKVGACDTIKPTDDRDAERLTQTLARANAGRDGQRAE